MLTELLKSNYILKYRRGCNVAFQGAGWRGERRGSASLRLQSAITQSGRTHFRRMPRCGWERMLEMRKKVRKPRGSYAVGYARPPASSQYQPGQSGNPQGRPKGVRNASSMARDALERTVNVKVKRSWRKMTVRKAAYLRVAERAAAGHANALDYLLSLESEERAPGSDQAEAQRSAAKDLAILQDFFDRRRGSLPQREHDDASSAACLMTADRERASARPKRILKKRPEILHLTSPSI